MNNRLKVGLKKGLTVLAVTSLFWAVASKYTFIPNLKEQEKRVKIIFPYLQKRDNSITLDQITTFPTAYNNKCQYEGNGPTYYETVNVFVEGKFRAEFCLERTVNQFLFAEEIKNPNRSY